MPFCSATCAIAVLWPESKAPTRSCAPSLISFSARARATSTLVSVSAFMIARSGRPRLFRIAGASSTPRWQSWPMLAWAPERGSRTPTFRGPPCAPTIDGRPRSVVAAPAVNARRVRVADDGKGNFRLMGVLRDVMARTEAAATDVGFSPSLEWFRCHRDMRARGRSSDAQLAGRGSRAGGAVVSARRDLDEVLDLLGAQRLVEKLELDRVAHGTVEVLHLVGLQRRLGLKLHHRLAHDVLGDARLLGGHGNRSGGGVHPVDRLAGGLDE